MRVRVFKAPDQKSGDIRISLFTLDLAYVSGIEGWCKFFLDGTNEKYYAPHTAEVANKALGAYLAFLLKQPHEINLPRLSTPTNNAPQKLSGWTLDLTKKPIELIETPTEMDRDGNIRLDEENTILVRRAVRPAAAQPAAQLPWPQWK